MWAPGNKPGASYGAAHRGFTLLELMLVVALMALAGAGVAFAVRESGDQALEREALRLAAQLDAARARSRASGQVLVWRPMEDGYRFEGPPPQEAQAHAWLAPGIGVQDAPAVVLGPEPIISPQEIVLVLGTRSLRVATDGLRPFQVRSAEADAPAPEAAP
jgi:general secretion pathway protein H